MTIPEQRRKDLEQIFKLYLQMSRIGVKINDFGEYNRVYTMTNEQLNGLLRNFKDPAGMRALSVLACGDQIFNFIKLGILEVDTFDCNRLTEYYALGFKKVAIENLSYQQFLNLFNWSKNQNKALEKEVINCAPEEYKWFWTELLDKLNNSGYPNAHVFDFMSMFTYHSAIRLKRNNYLASEISYKKLQENLKKSKITFTQADIKVVPEKFGKYDLIFLSNILDYHKQIFSNPDTISQALALLKKIYENNLNNTGELMHTSNIRSHKDYNMLGKIRDYYLKDTWSDIPEITGLRKGRSLWK